MNHYILIQDDVVKTFSIAGSGLDIQYTFAYKDKQDVFKDTAVGDKVLGYVDDPTDQFRYVFEVTQKISDKECIFKKKIEIEEGPALKDTNASIVSLVSANKSRTLFIKTSESQYNDVIRRMLNKSRKVLESREEESSKPICFETSLKKDFPRNCIIFGAPGTGKSFTINQEKEKLIGKDNETDYERVTFHPDYSYASFVGTYKPVPCIDSDGKDTITYKYVPGPFMRMLVKALKNGRTDNVTPFLLIIEEINRANVAAVFGDVFQLLDRNSKGVSEYPIEATEDMKKYLSEELGGAPEDYLKIKIPNNLFLWATMNSADQGVFPMDTAFKRRWEFKYIGINENDGDLNGKTVEVGSSLSQKVEWNKLRKAINNFLAKQKINEDKQLGPYFIVRDIVVPETGNEIDKTRFADTFKSKVIMYLFEDAAKQKRSSLFEGCFKNSSRYSEICKEFDEHGIGIFNQDIQMEAEPIDLTGPLAGTDSISK
ncbi:MAG: AAA domain-containing protein [Lachnospiraceae bacterium]|nr:AAA domain-containing protein [Lachnospiraceae bacterium]